MRPTRVIVLTALSMVAFAGNSLLCRLALKSTAIDPASFTSIRLVSGAFALWLILWFRSRKNSSRTSSKSQSKGRVSGNWLSASALFIYAAAFSFSYTHVSAGVGALLLFGAVQATMIGYGVAMGERLSKLQLLGLVTACAGLAFLFLPGLTAPPWQSALLMLASGVAWGVYSLRGRQAADATHATAGNFLRAAGLALLASLLIPSTLYLANSGIYYAALSGALTSGVGYAIWYSVMPRLSATVAATVQLTVPVLAALGAMVWLSEPFTLRVLMACVAILGGVALTIMYRKRTPLG